MIIFGTSPFSKLMKWYIENYTAEKITAFTAEKEYIQEKEFCGIPVIPFEELEQAYDKGRISILNTCGYHYMNDIREKVFDMCQDKGYRICSYIHPSVTLNGVKTGRGSIILENVLFQPFAEIGDGNIFAPDTLVGHDSVIGDFNYFSSGIRICGGCRIGNHNFTGTGVILKEHTCIRDYNLIGAGTFLNVNLEDYMTAAPVPCRIRPFTRENLDRLINR